jgi:Domain of unknown function (DUF4132)
MMPPRPDDDLRWLDAGDGYALAFAGMGLVARNARGRVLRTLPGPLRDSPVAVQLRELSSWLERHERECMETVETWMVRSLPVPIGVLIECWPDPAWRRPLENAVVGADAGGRLDRDRTGLLRGAGRERGVGIVTPDGETAWLRAPLILLPHPVLIEALDDFRELTTELGIEQVIPQLHRETWVMPDRIEPSADRVGEFAGGRFATHLDAAARCRSLGHRMSAGSAVTRVWEAGRLLEARYWIGNDAPEEEVETGDLIWVGPGGRQLRLAEVGPVAYSEGMRLAAAVYAGRITGEDER